MGGTESGYPVINPEDAATGYIVSYLGADTTLTGLGVNGIAPEANWGTLASPFVRVDFLDGSDLMVIGAQRIWSDLTYHIRGVFHWRGSGLPDRSTVNAIGNRIDALLHRHEDTTSTVRFYSFREDPEPTPTVVANNDLWLQSGGIYRIRATAL